MRPPITSPHHPPGRPSQKPHDRRDNLNSNSSSVDDPSSLRLRSNTLTWTNGGQTKTANLP